ncbi:LOW QUALITY PROTEIN: GDSL esterase/lipase At5g03600 [Sorghum bicolor]|uniref:LOW QUALITY PROTEIN: GDSL esterase/lipase At5g03600 n=1 Tax=Sorghum bicolor TaxID=4558 RepID=UPI000B425926|nr:LOW QUALITY PROTEIN: GDSL esterase/lipase At5g03600 [Sorghum bicolor]|eukprot:XP_021317038.1 LOW QUALITY PROTEIN: GDSL esterase/lipase At5g03600 [Sorghum bicolor]
MLFVFGDTFVDPAGNLAPTSEKSKASRQWFYPYGRSDSAHHNNPTGRVSDGLVQSDFLGSKDDVDASGVNFATAGASAYDSLSRQIDKLSRLVTRGTIEDRDLDDSIGVALIAFNGAGDYASVTVSTSSDQVMALSDKVTDAIADGVKRACCTGTHERDADGGYCGREDASGTPQYTLCSNPQDFFYWDYMHPTQAGWNAVMDRLQGSIHDFLRN